MTNDDKDLNQAVNTNQTIYRQPTTDYGPEDGNDKGMEPSVFVTKEGAVGFNHYGKCVVKPIKEWVEMAWNTPQQSSEPLKELDEDELFAIISKHNTNNPDRFYNPKEMTNDRQLAIDICERFGQPSEKKALSVEEMKKIMWDLENKLGYQPAYETIAQAIESALPARKEVKWPEKMAEDGESDISIYDDQLEKRVVIGKRPNKRLDAIWFNKGIDACIAAYEEAMPAHQYIEYLKSENESLRKFPPCGTAQREVRYPEKEYCGKINTALHNDNCEECKYHKLRNKLIDKMKKLNGG